MGKRLGFRIGFAILLLALCLWTRPGVGQSLSPLQQPPAQPGPFEPAGPFAPETTSTPARQDLEEALHALSERAGIIFLGEVVQIRRIDGAGTSAGSVEIAFRVEAAIRGVRPGQTCLLREWAGLWAGDQQRYRLGQRLLMLLHPSPTGGPTVGLSSPVGGMDGAIPIVPASFVPGTAQTPPAATVDLRWIATRVLQHRDPLPRLRAPRPPLQEDPSGETSSRAPLSTVALLSSNAQQFSSSRPRNPAPEQHADMPLPTLLSLLGQWERAR